MDDMMTSNRRRHRQGLTNKLLMSARDAARQLRGRLTRSNRGQGTYCSHFSIWACLETRNPVLSLTFILNYIPDASGQ